MVSPGIDLHSGWKIVFTGTMGAGKTTAIRAISDRTMLATEVPITGVSDQEDKKLTTVGFDYGECRLDETVTLRLFGTPGQERFRFMWQILATGAFGIIVLADNSRRDPIGDVLGYLRTFSAWVPRRRTVVAVGRTKEHAHPGIDDYHVRLAEAGFSVPVLEVDVRRPEDVRLVLSVLVSMVEVESA